MTGEVFSDGVAERDAPGLADALGCVPAKVDAHVNSKTSGWTAKRRGAAAERGDTAGLGAHEAGAREGSALPLAGLHLHEKRAGFVMELPHSPRLRDGVIDLEM